MDSTYTNAINRFIGEVTPALSVYARHWGGDAEDLVQEVLLKLVRETNWPDNPRAWAFRVLRNLALNRQRAGYRRTKHESLSAQQRESWFELRFDQVLDGDAATRHLLNLSDDDREIVVARIWGELSFEEIAALVDRPLSTVHRRYGAALETLKQRLESPPNMTNKLPSIQKSVRK